MEDLEIPLGKRTAKYRFFEMLPGILSYGAFALVIILSLLSPLLAAIYLLLIVITVAVKAVGIVYHTIVGHNRLQQAQKIDWKSWLAEFEDPAGSYESHQGSRSRSYGFREHKDNLRLAAADPAAFPKPSQLHNLVIIAAYNESFEVLDPTVQSVLDTTYDNDKLLLVLAYEERGGEVMESTAQRLQKKYGSKFKEFILVKHPDGLPNEILTGKGGNITYAGKYMQQWFTDKGIAFKDVLVTTLDSDNRPHKSYFDYMTYEFVINENRKHLAYQPIALFINNIWDVPAPMRVVATGNTFWNIISAMRPHTMRNFASHSQPMEALVEMGFWSTRTIVEDGHQFWRSYFHFSGNYSVTPLYIPIYQDAVLDNTYVKTLRAQFIQLRRWMYGVSDIAYIATHLFTSKRTVPFWPGFVWFVRALDGYVTAACVSIIIALGAWVPLLINSQSYHNVVAHQLPEAVSIIQRIVLVGLIVIVFLAFKMLPPRPERYKRHRTIWMVLQWGLMPITAITYLSFAALNAQTRLLFGRYLVKFDVTNKATVQSRDKVRSDRKKKNATS